MWKQIKNFENYYISLEGKIKSSLSNKELKPSISPNGYLKVILRKNNKSFTKSIHRLVAENFIENIENYPTVNHIDGNKLNNNINNLEWSSYRNNMKHAIITGLRNDQGENSKNSKLKTSNVLEIIKLAKEDKLKNVEIAKKFNISPFYVSQIINNKRWKHV